MEEEKIEEVTEEVGKVTDEFSDENEKFSVEGSPNLDDSQNSDVLPMEKIPLKNECSCGYNGKNLTSPGVRDDVHQEEGNTERCICKTPDNAVIDRCSKREKSSSGKRKNRKTVTDEGHEFMEEEIIDNFAIISFKSIQDLQKYEAEEEEKKQKEEELKRKEEEQKHKAEQKLFKPVATRKRDTNRNKENSIAVAQHTNTVDDSRTTDETKERMAVKRLLEENDREVVVATKLPKTELQEHENQRQAHSVPERILSPSSNGIIVPTPPVPSNSKPLKISSPRSPKGIKIDTGICSENVGQEKLAENAERASSVIEGSNNFKSRTEQNSKNHLEPSGNLLTGLLATANQTDIVNSVLDRSGLHTSQFPYFPGLPPLPGLGFTPGYPFMPSSLVSQFCGNSGRNSDPVPGTSSASIQTPKHASSGQQKKSGRWCAMHVRIAWDIHKQEQQKKRTQENKECFSSAGPSTSYTSTSMGSAGVERTDGDARKDRKCFTNSKHSVLETDKDKPLPLLTDSTAERHKVSGKEKESGRSSSKGLPSGSLVNGSLAPDKTKFFLCDSSTAKGDSFVPHMNFGLSSGHLQMNSLNNSSHFSNSLLPTVLTATPSSSGLSGVQEKLRTSGNTSVSEFPGRSCVSTASASGRNPGATPTPAGSLPPLPVPNFSQAAIDALIRPQGAVGLPSLPPFGFMKDMRLPGGGLMDPYAAAAARQRQLDILNSSILEREQRERTEEFLRIQAQQQQALLQRNQSGGPGGLDGVGAGALTGLLERELLERQRMLLGGSPQGSVNPFAVGLPGLANFPGASASGVLPHVTPGMDLLGRNSALPSGFPNPLVAVSLAGGGLGPFGNPFAMGKLPMPFSNTLEQLARQKRDNEHVLNR